MKTLIFSIVIIFLNFNQSFANDRWKWEWPYTDFSKKSISFDEILSGGPPKDGIPSIDNPKFKPVDKISNLDDKEPVISFVMNGDARAYPIRILMYHEIVNDVVGNIPVSITYCPLCNASLVFDRTVNGKMLDFGTTGKLRLSDMIMYDRQTQSWWQQFTGEAIVGYFTGTRLKPLPSRIESFSLFKERFPKGRVLVPNNPDAKPYGKTPYTGYDSTKWPSLFTGNYKGPVPALARVVAVGKHAWPLSLVKEKKQIIYQDLVISWQEGQLSPLDTEDITKGKDIGNVVVKRNGQDVVYHLPFAFAFIAFNPNGIIHTHIK